MLQGFPGMGRGSGGLPKDTVDRAIDLICHTIVKFIVYRPERWRSLDRLEVESDAAVLCRDDNPIGRALS